MKSLSLKDKVLKNPAFQTSLQKMNILKSNRKLRVKVTYIKGLHPKIHRTISFWHFYYTSEKKCSKRSKIEPKEQGFLNDCDLCKYVNLLKEIKSRDKIL